VPIPLSLKRRIQSTFREALRIPALRGFLNRVIDRTSDDFKKRVHSAFGLVFDDFEGSWRDGPWRVTFAGKQISVPLEKPTLHIDWITAVTLLGHDLEEKQTYRNLLASPLRPDIFVDIGGNLGTHSLMMMAHGIRTLYVEPNSTCHAHFARYCRHNSLTCEVVACALGETAGREVLAFPERQTWLGTTQPDLIRELAGDHRLVERAVDRRTVDDLTLGIQSGKLLIKIDAEGSERKILAGAVDTIARLRPFFLFEAHGRERRSALVEFFAGVGYRIGVQPWRDGAPHLSREAFLSQPAFNFVAYPV
jgi:FkbM family methyltransferase